MSDTRAVEDVVRAVPTAPASTSPADHVRHLQRLDEDCGAELVGAGASRQASDLWPFALKYGSAADGPLVVCRPATHDAARAVLRYASRHGLRLLPFGAGSNVVGAIDGGADVVLSLERLSGVRDLDTTSQTVTVGAGTNAAALEDELNRHGLTLGIYPQSLRISTIGGWVATRATGTLSARYGGIERSIVGVRGIFPDGSDFAVDPRVRPAGGMDLLSLLVGAEGSLAVVTEVSLLVRRQLSQQRVAAGFRSFEQGLDAQRELLQRELPIGLLRLYNESESDVVLPPELAGQGQFLLSVTVVAPDELLEASRRAVMDVLTVAGGRPLPDTAGDAWFAHRYDAETLMQDRNSERSRFFDTIEVGIPWSAAAACAGALEASLTPLATTFHMHSSHAYVNGTCLYMILDIHDPDPERLRARWDACWTTALATVQQHGGTVAHHHGVGTLRSAYYGDSVEGAVHRLVKSALDPHGTLYSRALQPPTAGVGGPARTGAVTA
jgi:alkyldihydroxyacetonephosphate synthase